MAGEEEEEEEMNCHLLITSRRTDKGRDKKEDTEENLSPIQSDPLILITPLNNITRVIDFHSHLNKEIQVTVHPHDLDPAGSK